MPDYRDNDIKALDSWSVWLRRGGIGALPLRIPPNLIDLSDKISAHTAALIGISLALGALDRVGSADLMLSGISKKLNDTPDAASDALPMAVMLSLDAGGDRKTLLRGMGCFTALTLMHSGAAVCDQDDRTIGEIVKDGGSLWKVSVPPGAPESVTTLETLGAAMAVHVLPDSGDDTWSMLAGSPAPALFEGWREYLKTGLDRPVDAIPFSLLGEMKQSGKLVDSMSGTVISIAIVMAAYGEAATADNLLHSMREAAREAEENRTPIPRLLGKYIHGAYGGGPRIDIDNVRKATACFALLSLWSANMVSCLDPHHTLRKMAMERSIRFEVQSGKVYTLEDFSLTQNDGDRAA